MKQKKKRKIWYILGVFFFLVFILKLSIKQHIVLNITPSIPLGIYILTDYDHQKELAKGTVVLFDPPRLATKNRIYYNPLLKKVAATSSDNVEIRNSRLFINGKYQGAIQKTDSMGNRINMLREGIYIISPGEYFVLGDHENSYDSRYYGSLTKKEILQCGKILIPFSM